MTGEKLIVFQKGFDAGFEFKSLQSEIEGYNSLSVHYKKKMWDDFNKLGIKNDTMTTSEGNKLIAEYAGFVLGGDSKHPLCYISSNGGYFPNGQNLCKIEHLQYHMSYHWIMSIIDLIYKDGCIINISLSGEINKKSCSIDKFLSKLRCWSSYQESDDLVEAIWLSVIEYIKWHNSNNKNKTK